jgi:hypothetical protein
MNTVSLFKLRLKREGRYDLYAVRMEELKALYPAEPAIVLARKCREEFGFLGKGEIPASQEYRDAAYMEKRQREQRKAQKAQSQKRRAKSFDEALSALPHTADPAKEMDWVGAHPAMYRLKRGEVDEATGNVVITAKDITDSIAGPAPSKRAVVQLNTWANDPETFLKAVISEHKKAQVMGDVGDGNVAPDSDLAEVRRMLASVESRIKDEAAA